MRTRIAFLTGLGAGLLAPAPLPAQAPFEGAVTYRFSMEGIDATMRYLVKGTKIRQEMEIPGMPGPMFMLMDLEGDVAQMVMPSMGMYTEMDLAQAKAALPPPARGDTEVPKLTKLGTSDVVAGIKCDNYRFGTDLEACVATGMGWYLSGPSRGMGRGGPMPSGPDLSAYRQEFKDGMLPLRMRHLREGNWALLMEATSVEKKPQDPSLFVLPPGLRKMTQPAPPGGDA